MSIQRQPSAHDDKAGQELSPTARLLRERREAAEQQPLTPEEQAELDAGWDADEREMQELREMYEAMLRENPEIAERIAHGPSLMEILDDDRGER